MVQAIINLGEREDRVITIVKGKYGLKNKSDAVNFIIDTFEKELLEPQLRPEYIQKIGKIFKEKGKTFTNVNELRSLIEDE